MTIWPQLTYLAFLLFGLGVVGAKHGDPAPDFSFWRTLISAAITLTVLYYGGFFAPLGWAP